MIWDKIYIFRTNLAILRDVRAYCREDFREDVARRKINKVASKITSASEVNTGILFQFLFLNYVKAFLSTSLKLAVKVRVIQVIRMSAVVFFGQIQCYNRCVK